MLHFRVKTCIILGGISWGSLKKETVLEEEEVYEEVDDSEVDDEEVEDEQEEETEEETEEEEPDLYTHDQVEAAVKTRVKTLQ